MTEAQPSPPRPNLKEIRERVARVMEPHLFEMLDRHKDDCPYCQSARTFAMRQADRAIEATGIDSLLSERDEARAALEIADKAMTRDFCGWGDELNAIRAARAMRGNAE